MPNILQVLKEEIRRLARKEAKLALAGLVRDKIYLKKTITNLKSRVTELERDNRRLVAAENKRQKAQARATGQAAQRLRITSQGIRALRRKLRLSQAGLAALLGVSEQSVYMWERKDGRLLLRETTKQALFVVRNMGAREAKRQLEATRQAELTTSKRRTGPKRKKVRTTRKKR